MDKHTISSEHLSIDAIKNIINANKKIELSEESRNKIQACRNYLDKKLESGDAAIYGVNTGFGSLCKVKISNDEIEQLQYNLIRSHACGTGEVIDDDITKIMLLLKIQSLSYGFSGVSIDTVWRLMDLFNFEILPVIYEQGSLGASGDLCPLSHMSMALIGEGEVKISGKIFSAKKILDQHKLTPIRLRSKEGLALLNGTQFMSAHAVYCLIKAKHVLQMADLVSALSLEAWNCKHDAFLPQIHQVRNQNGQIETAKNMLEILEGSETFFIEKEQVQDPYSFRCIPQVHGASKDAVSYCWEIVEREINGVTDNPNVFVDDDMILSGGNFHGQPLAISLDFLAIALSELASISERRTYRMLSGARGLPEFLAVNAGLHSGLMIPQYVAASIVSQNKQLCTPASVDSIASSNEQEDHVSMGANAATKCVRVVENVEKVLAIELLTAAQAFAFRKGKKSSAIIEKLYADYRKDVSFIDADRYLHDDIMKSVHFLKTFK